MSDSLFESTKVTAYFLWETTNCANALSLWYCAEDIASYFEKKGYIEPADVYRVMGGNIYDIRRIAFVRHIAFRIYIYTENHNKLDNWYAAERLLNNAEWVNAACTIAAVYHENKQDFSKLSGIRSEQVRQYYHEQR